MDIKYFGELGLTYLINNIKTNFSKKTHTHTSTEVINSLGYVPARYGIYSFEINANGELCVIYEDENSKPEFYINDDGYLILTLSD